MLVNSCPNWVKRGKGKKNTMVSVKYVINNVIVTSLLFLMTSFQGKVCQIALPNLIYMLMLKILFISVGKLKYQTWRKLYQ